jgi:hypothetical protein
LLRTVFLNGELGATTSDFIPIVQPDGSRFLLVMRDVTEFEIDTSPIVPWATDGSLIMETSTPLTTSRRRMRMETGNVLFHPANEAGIIWRRSRRREAGSLWTIRKSASW